MKEFKIKTMYVIAIIVAIVLVFVFIGLDITVINSNLPVWLKWLILHK